MSSPEQAPEPTMDEILASIRKIISDEQPEQEKDTATGAAAQAPAPPEPAQAPPQSKTSLVDDIASALDRSPAAGAPQPAAQQAGSPPQEDIFELTKVAAPETRAPEQPVDAEFPETDTPESAPPASGVMESADAALTAALSEATGESIATRTGPGTGSPGGDALGGRDSRLDVSFAGQREPAREQPQPPFEKSLETGMFDPGDEDFEASATQGTASEPSAEPESVPAAAKGQAAETPVFDTGGRGGSKEAPATASPDYAPDRSLEDSVKDMLRPMLRDWLDENLPRMVEGALKDELKSRKD